MTLVKNLPLVTQDQYFDPLVDLAAPVVTDV